MIADLNIPAQKLKQDRTIQVVVFQSPHPEIFVAHADAGIHYDINNQRTFNQGVIAIQ